MKQWNPREGHAVMTASMGPQPMSSSILAGHDVPDTLPEQIQLAEIIFQSKRLVPEVYRQGNSADLIVLMLHARALDVPFTTLLWETYPGDDGELVMSAKLMHMRARRFGYRLTWLESDSKVARVLAKSIDNPEGEEFSYTFAEAQAGGWTLPERDVDGWWTREPKACLMARVTRRSIQAVCPEAMLGVGEVVSSEMVASKLAPSRVRAADLESDADDYDEALAKVMADAVDRIARVRDEPDPSKRLTAYQDLYNELKKVRAEKPEGDERTLREILVQEMQEASKEKQAARKARIPQQVRREEAPGEPSSGLPPVGEGGAPESVPEVGTEAVEDSAGPEPVEKTLRPEVVPDPPTDESADRSADRPADAVSAARESGLMECGCKLATFLQNGEHRKNCKEYR